MTLNYLHWWLLLHLWDPEGGAPNQYGWCSSNRVLTPPRIKGQGCSLVPSVEVDPPKTHWSGHGGLEGHRWAGRGRGGRWLIFPLPPGGHSQESPPGGCESFSKRLRTKEQGCHLMEELDRMVHWLSACWTPSDVLFDPHNSPVREMQTRALRHIKMKPAAQGPHSRAGFEPGFVPVWSTREPQASLYILTLVQGD